jgi:hypothetical protein
MPQRAWAWHPMVEEAGLGVPAQGYSLFGKKPLHHCPHRENRSITVAALMGGWGCEMRRGGKSDLQFWGSVIQ